MILSHSIKNLKLELKQLRRKRLKNKWLKLRLAVIRSWKRSSERYLPLTTSCPSSCTQLSTVEGSSSMTAGSLPSPQKTRSSNWPFPRILTSISPERICWLFLRPKITEWSLIFCRLTASSTSEKMSATNSFQSKELRLIRIKWRQSDWSISSQPWSWIKEKITMTQIQRSFFLIKRSLISLSYMKNSRFLMKSWRFWSCQEGSGCLSSTLKSLTPHSTLSFSPILLNPTLMRSLFTYWKDMKSKFTKILTSPSWLM